MPIAANTETVPRKDLHVFFVLDTSGSMTGAKIAALNHAMNDTIQALHDLAKNHGDAKLKIAVMEFNTGANWITNHGPEDAEEDFEYEFLEAGGLTDIGSALKELNNKLDRNQFLNSMTGAYMPVIIFMTDGFATDDYEKELEAIRRNRWFKRGTKIGFALGDDPDIAMISSVVGNSEAVIKTSDLELFKKLMRFVAVTSSMRVSSSIPVEKTGGAEQIVKDALEEAKSGMDPIVRLSETEYHKEIIEPEPAGDDWDDTDEEDW